MSSDLQYPFPEPPEHGEAMTVAPGVKWVRMPLPMALDHINLYLLDAGDGWWIVDSGLGDEATREQWERVFDSALDDKPVHALLCTHMHPDHTGQAGWLCQRWKMPLHMTLGEYMSARVFGMLSHQEPSRRHILRFFHRAGLGDDYAPVAPSESRDNRSRSAFGGGYAQTFPMPPFFRRLRDGQTLDIGATSWQIIVGSGHSPEHACLYDAERRILLSGDQVIPRITPNVSVSPMEPEGNPLADWFESLPRFAALPADTLVLPAHNTPFYGLRERVGYLLSHHERHLETLLENLAEPRRAVDLLPVLFKRSLSGQQMFLALGECVAHLHMLRARGQIERERAADGVYLYRRQTNS